MLWQGLGLVFLYAVGIIEFQSAAFPEGKPADSSMLPAGFQCVTLCRPGRDAPA